MCLWYQSAKPAVKTAVVDVQSPGLSFVTSGLEAKIISRWSSGGLICGHIYKAPTQPNLASLLGMFPRINRRDSDHEAEPRQRPIARRQVSRCSSCCCGISIFLYSRPQSLSAYTLHYLIYNLVYCHHGSKARRKSGSYTVSSHQCAPKASSDLEQFCRYTLLLRPSYSQTASPPLR